MFPPLPAWTRLAVTEQEMHVAAQGAAQAVESARVVLVIIAIAVAVFWRVLLRLVLAIIAIAILMAIGSGVVVLLNAGHL